MKVNTLIIGTQKGGTTSLFNYLQQHPNVCASKIKETNFFLEDRLYSLGEDSLHQYFNDCSDKKIVLTSHAHLLPGIDVPKKVFQYNPTMKLILVLRNPTDRAYSAFRHAVKHGWESEKTDFINAVRKDWHPDLNFRELYDLAYVRNGLYHSHLSNWEKLFSRSNFLILTSKELNANTEIALKKVYDFLEIETMPVNTEERLNEGGKAKYKFIQLFIKNIVKNHNNPIKKMLKIILPKSFSRLFRSQVMPWLFRKNTIVEKLELDSADRKIVNNFFESDLRKLEENYGVKL